MKLFAILLALAATAGFSACVSDQEHGMTHGAGHSHKPGHSHGTPSTGIDASSEPSFRAQ
jgi:hypothetical protein